MPGGALLEHPGAILQRLGLCIRTGEALAKEGAKAQGNGTLSAHLKLPGAHTVQVDGYRVVPVTAAWA